MKKLLTLLFLLSVIASGCAVSADSGNLCSRKSIESAVFAGYGPDDDLTAACRYVYDSEMFRKKYGDEFDISDNAGSNGETDGGMIGFIGVSHCYLEIGKDIWRVDLSKELFGKWKVTGCHLCEDEETARGNINVNAENNAENLK